MKNKNILDVFLIILLSIALIFGLIMFIVSLKSNNSQTATWFGAIVTAISILFIYRQILNQEKEHQANLKVYVTQKRSAYMDKDNFLDIPGDTLNIIPVNIGLVPGSYRLLGVCKKKDWDQFLKKELLKIKNNEKVNAGLFREKFYFRNKDIVPRQIDKKDKNRKPISDLTGMELIYPHKNSKFENISPKGVGKIRNFPLYNELNNPEEETSIQKKLKILLYEPTKLVVVYLDPNFNPYIGETTITLDNSLLEALSNDQENTTNNTKSNQESAKNN